jgi:hypothetical protein
MIPAWFVVKNLGLDGNERNAHGSIAEEARKREEWRAQSREVYIARGWSGIYMLESRREFWNRQAPSQR